MPDYRGAGNQRLAGTLGTATGYTVGWSLRTDALPFVGVEVGTAWGAADIGIDVSTDNSSYIALYDNNGSLVKVAGTAGWLAAGVYWFGTNALPVAVYPYFRFHTYGAGAGTTYLPTWAEVLNAVLVY